MEQPYVYTQTPLVEPDWTRIPAWADVTADQWANPQWQRVNCVKNLNELKNTLGGLLDDNIYDLIARDQQTHATMSMLVPPQMLNTIAPTAEGASYQQAFAIDPIRRYMIPMVTDRLTVWHTHPYASRDSLHEHDMWATEGLTHRYPTKVLAELLTTCPQYCGHCTRMDLVGNSTPQVDKLKFIVKQPNRHQAMLDYIKATPTVRDVVVSGGDVANMPWPRLHDFIDELLNIDHIKDIRLATKALIGLPQHWGQDAIVEGLAKLCDKANNQGASIAIHTHANHAASITPAVAHVVKTLRQTGLRDIRNQGVLLAGVNTTSSDLLDLCFSLSDGANITPYYFYMCDMIPAAEHWRISLEHAQNLQHAIMGYLPGFATPRIVCDVPFVGKRWVHQVDSYDKQLGISYWSKNYITTLEKNTGHTQETYTYYDPIHTLGELGQHWWTNQINSGKLDNTL